MNKSEVYNSRLINVYSCNPNPHNYTGYYHHCVPSRLILANSHSHTSRVNHCPKFFNTVQFLPMRRLYKWNQTIVVYINNLVLFVPEQYSIYKYATIYLLIPLQIDTWAVSSFGLLQTFLYKFFQEH